MTVRIRVRDFQSIEDAEIEVSGLTVITGANNTGKSACLRAVHGVFTNARGTKYVRHGKDHCAVTVTFGDGREVTWEKGEKTNRYTVDGKTLDKVGSGVPPEVGAFGIAPITAAGRDLWPQFAQQFTGQVFLLDQPGSVLAESIADVSRVGVLNDALRNVQSDRKALSSELKVRLGDVARLEALEATFAGLDGAERLAAEADAIQAEAEALRARLKSTITLRDAVTAHAATVSWLTPVAIVSVPEGFDEGRDQLATLDELTGLSLKLSLVNQVHASLSPVASIAIPDEGDISRAEKVSDALRLVCDIRSQMAPLLSALGNADEIRQSVSGYLPDPRTVEDDLADLVGYQSLRRDMALKARAVASLSDEVLPVTREIEEASREIHDLLAASGTCPTCGASHG